MYFGTSAIKRVIISSAILRETGVTSNDLPGIGSSNPVDPISSEAL